MDAMEVSRDWKRNISGEDGEDSGEEGSAERAGIEGHLRDDMES